MPVITIMNMGLKGINTDMTNWDLPAEYITSGKNFRVFGNAIRATGGTADWSNVPASIGTAGHMHTAYWDQTTSNVFLVAGTQGIYAFQGGGTIIDSGPYVGIDDDNVIDWQGTNLGSIALMNHFNHFPLYWPSAQPSFPMSILPYDSTQTWQDVDRSCKVMRSHKSFLIALNIRQGGNYYPNTFHWSHPADINGIPPSWDYNDRDFLSGIAEIGGDAGKIIDGRSLRDEFAIYTENGISLLTESGDSFVFNLREMSSTIGLAAPNALVSVKGNHFFLGDDDILMNDGSQVSSIAHNKIRRGLANVVNTDKIKNSFALRHDQFKEIWFCVPEVGEDYATIAFVYNYKDDSWQIRDLIEPTIHAAQGTYGDAPKNWITWQGNWNQQTLNWTTRSRGVIDLTIAGIQDDTFRFLDPVGEAVTSGDLNAKIERINFPLEGHEKVTTITRVYPHIEGKNPVKIQFGSQDSAYSDIRWKPAVVFTPGKDRKIDVRTTGELHCWRIESIDQGRFNMSGMTIEYQMSGAR
jgi:hypothetical protein